jgi:hypothetical protein
MTFALTEEARGWRDKLRVFVENELQPFSGPRHFPRLFDCL